MPEVGSPPTHPPVLAGPCVYHRMLLPPPSLPEKRAPNGA